MPILNRRRLLMAATAGGVMAAARPLRAQNKPDKLVYIGDNQGGWKRALTEEVAPAFEKETGIKVEFTLLPPDAWLARMKAEFGAGSSGIDIAQWSVGMAGWINEHWLAVQALAAHIGRHEVADLAEHCGPPARSARRHCERGRQQQGRAENARRERPVLQEVCEPLELAVSLEPPHHRRHDKWTAA